ANLVFQQFQEAQITFPPSYKFDAGTDNYDTSTPSWCDRILWCKNDDVENLSYQSHPSLKMSDHKPVSASFNIKEKYDRVHQNVIRALDKFENESLPDATLDKNTLIYDSVYYKRPKTMKITLSNVGPVIVSFRFVPKLNDKTFCKPWLNVTPAFGMLLPGDSIPISFVVNITNETVAALNSQTDKIEDIVILNLENGKDFFVTVSGDFQPTCFGMPLSTLVHLHGPVRLRPKKGSVPLDIPKEIWRMVDYIYNFGLKTEGLFTIPGEQGMVDYIRECLDTGEPFNLPVKNNIKFN
ncbi:DNase I-like protein, partial [Rozella allomycis CSF55]